MYSVVYADPPWDYKGQSQHNKNKELTGGAEVHYNTMTTEELIEYFQPWIKDNTEKSCILFMWSSSPHLNQAIKLGEGWGFKYKTIAFVWNKMITNPGYYTLSQNEICLAFTKNGIPKPRGSRKERQYIESKRREHSRKPDEVRDRINAMFPTQKKVELFARTQSEGWDVVGNEIEKFD